MAIATNRTASNYLQRAPSPSGLADVTDLIIDKGLVIGDRAADDRRGSMIASVDTYLGFAEDVNRIDLTETELAGHEELRSGKSRHGSSKPKDR